MACKRSRVRISYSPQNKREQTCCLLSLVVSGDGKVPRAIEQPTPRHTTTGTQQPAHNNRHSDIPTDNSIPATHHLSCPRHLSHNTPANPRHTNLSHCIPAIPHGCYLSYWPPSSCNMPFLLSMSIARHLSCDNSSRRSANRQKNSRENFRSPGRLKRSPAYLTALTIASNAFGSFIARSARTLRFRAIPLVLSLPINCE